MKPSRSTTIGLASVMITLLALFGLAAPALASFSGTDVFIPSLGSGPGASNSQWNACIWVYNPNTAPVNVTYSLLLRNQPNPSPQVFNATIAAGDTQRYDNALVTLFGVTTATFGAVRVTTPAGQPVIVNARSYSTPAGGDQTDTVGQFYAAVPASFAIGPSQKTELLGVYQTTPQASSEFRYNYGFVETTGNSVTVQVTALDQNGTSIGSKSYTLGGFEAEQFNITDLLPAVNTTNVRLEVAVTSGPGQVVAFGSGIANTSNDPSTFEMSFQDDLLAANSATSGLTSVAHDGTLQGDGTTATPLGIANGGVGTTQLANGAVGTPQLAGGAVTVAKISPTGSAAGQVPTSNGSSVAWQNPVGLTLPYAGTITSDTSTAFSATNVGKGTAIYGISNGYAVGGLSPSGVGVTGLTSSGAGVLGVSGNLPDFLQTTPPGAPPAVGVYGSSSASDGILGITTGTNTYGVHGKSSYQGVFGESTQSATSGCLGCPTAGAIGYTTDASLVGLLGNNVAGGVGIQGNSTNTATGVTGPGVLGVSPSGYGVEGLTSTSSGVYGENQATSNAGCLGCAVAGVNGYSTQPSYAAVWGNNAGGSGGIGVYGTGDYGVYGFGTTYSVYCNGNGGYTGSWNNLSDRRLKRDVVPLVDALDKVLQLRGVSFSWRREEFPQKRLNAGPQIGFIAQEVEEIYPELVFTDPEGYKSLDYSKLTPILTEAIKEQQAQIEELKAALADRDARQAEVETFAARLTALEVRMAAK